MYIIDKSCLLNCRKVQLKKEVKEMKKANVIVVLLLFLTLLCYNNTTKADISIKNITNEAIEIPKGNCELYFKCKLN